MILKPVLLQVAAARVGLSSSDAAAAALPADARQLPLEPFRTLPLQQRKQMNARWDWAASTHDARILLPVPSALASLSMLLPLLALCRLRRLRQLSDEAQARIEAEQQIAQATALVLAAQQPSPPPPESPPPPPPPPAPWLPLAPAQRAQADKLLTIFENASLEPKCE